MEIGRYALAVNVRNPMGVNRHSRRSWCDGRMFYAGMQFYVMRADDEELEDCRVLRPVHPRHGFTQLIVNSKRGDYRWQPLVDVLKAGLVLKESTLDDLVQIHYVGHRMLLHKLVEEGLVTRKQIEKVLEGWK